MDGEPLERADINVLASQEHHAKKRAETLLEGTAYEYRGILDPRRDSRKGEPKVFAVKYTGDAALPDGQGLWSAKNTDYDLHSVTGPWLEIPEVGSELALKMQLLTSNLDRERFALAQCNTLFAPDDAVRPLRLYAYGNGMTLLPDTTKEAEHGYLLEEKLPDTFIPMAKLDITTMTSSQRMQVVVGLASFLRTIHEGGIAHGDLEGPSAINEHIYYDLATGSMRVMDFSHAERPEGNEDFPDILGLDRAGLTAAIESFLVSSPNGSLSEEAEKISKECAGEFRYEYPDTNDEQTIAIQIGGQPMTADGTAEIHRQLVALQSQMQS